MVLAVVAAVRKVHQVAMEARVVTLLPRIAEQLSLLHTVARAARALMVLLVPKAATAAT